MKTSAELRARLEALRGGIKALAALENITDEQDADLNAKLTEFAELEGTDDEPGLIAKADERERLMARVNAGASIPPAAPNFIKPKDPTETPIDAPVVEIRDAAKRLIDAAPYLSAEQKESVTKNTTGRTQNRNGDEVARRVVATEHPDYQSAFVKAVAGQEAEWTDAERAAMSRFRNAMSTTGNAGGFGVPVLIDPTVLITDGQGLFGLLQYARIESITTDAWKGVSAAHTAWSSDAEAAEVSDDASTFAQPTVNTHKPQAFIPYSIEIGQDYPGFASEMSTLLADGYMDYLAEKAMVGAGDGSNEGFGVFATGVTTVDVGTDNSFLATDLDAVWAAVPEKFRARAVWCMNVDAENLIRGFGSGTATSRFTVDQTREGISLLNGRPVVLSDHAPSVASTLTDAQNVLAVGDPRNFLIAQRVGMTVEVVPHLFATGANRPSGQRGLYAYARVGHDIIVDNSWRVLKNQTT